MIALLQQRGESDSSWLFQLVFVFFFFVLPILRTAWERRKRSEKEGQADAGPPARRAEPEDPWKDLLAGRLGEPEASLSEQPEAPAPTKPTREASSAPTSVGPSLSTRSSRPSDAAGQSPTREPSLRVRRRKRPTAPAAPAAPETVRRERITDRADIGQLSEGLAGLELGPKNSGGPLAKVPAGSMGSVDPGTLDDEIAARWGESSRAPSVPAGVLQDTGQGTPQPARTSAADWRRAIVLSELLSPPLALRGPTSAWPGPPAAHSAPPR